LDQAVAVVAPPVRPALAMPELRVQIMRQAPAVPAMLATQRQGPTARDGMQTTASVAAAVAATKLLVAAAAFMAQVAVAGDMSVSAMEVPAAKAPTASSSSPTHREMNA
jgi:hypothetical protein